jgi:hypothetical protein
MPPLLRKSLSGRWITDHSREIQINYQHLDVLISKLQQVQKEFVPNSVVRCTLEPGIASYARFVLRGDRYATRAEVTAHTSEERARKDKALREKRDRINAALDVLRQDAPGILNRTDITADELEETAV